MKHLLFSLLFLYIPNMIYASDIIIKDEAFLTALLNHDFVIDTNKDGKIQQEEAEAINKLNVSGSGIKDLSGIESFVNLTKLDCEGNELTELNLTGMQKLRELYCSNNSIKKIQGIGRLQMLHCSYNQLEELLIPGSIVLALCNNNQLKRLVIMSRYDNLGMLNCSANQLEELDLSACAFLEELDCSQNKLVKLKIPGSSLKKMNCSNNRLTKLELNHSKGLGELNCAENQITQLTIMNIPKLKEVNCNSNVLKDLCLYNLPKMKVLLCENNDLSTLNFKNGQMDSLLISCVGNTNLVSICTDEKDQIHFPGKFNVPVINKDCLQNYPLLPLFENKQVKDLTIDERNVFELSLKNLAKDKAFHPDTLARITKVDVTVCKKLYVLGYEAVAVTMINSKGEQKPKTSRYYYLIKARKLNDNVSTILNENNWEIVHVLKVLYGKPGTSDYKMLHEIAELNFDDVRYDSYTKEFAHVRKGSKWGMIDEEGNYFIDVKYDQLILASNGCLLGQQNQKWGIIYYDGKSQTEIKYDFIQQQGFPRVGDTRLLVVGINGKYGFINQQLKEVTPLIYDDLNTVSNNYPIGKRENKMVLIDITTGREKTPLKYDFISYLLGDDILTVGTKEPELYGIIDSSGREILPVIYSDYQIPRYGCMVYKRNGKYGLIETTGWKEITLPKFDFIDGDFVNGITEAKLNGKDVLLTDKGEIKEQ